MSTPTVVVSFGTRPEANKMAPVIQALQASNDVRTYTLVTGQHREQLADSLASFSLTADANLSVMTERQTLPQLFGRIVPAAAETLTTIGADYVLVHGDTATTFAVAFAAYMAQIPVGHVEAGLRSFNLQEPFPEEANRRLTDVLTDLDFAPTAQARNQLLAEGKPASRVLVTGNTAVDAAYQLRGRARLPAHLTGKRLVTITMHRRENLPFMAELAAALARVAAKFPEHTFVYPMHLNPAVRERVVPALGNVPNVQLCEPLSYLPMLALLDQSELVITDSGGIQEEGAALGTPVAVLRNVTERPEGVDAGVVTLVGTEPREVETRLRDLLQNNEQLAWMRTRPNPFGDGKAGERIAQGVRWHFGLAERPADWSGP